MNAISHYADDEKILPSSKPNIGPLFRINTARQLPERRIYSYLEVKGPNGTTDQWALFAEIKAKLNGVPAGAFPVCIGNIQTTTTGQNKSLPSLFNAGGSAVGDSLAIRIANPFDTTNGPFVAVIQPLRINAEIDELEFNVLSFWGSTIVGYRAYLACLSTRY